MVRQLQYYEGRGTPKARGERGAAEGTGYITLVNAQRWSRGGADVTYVASTTPLGAYTLCSRVVPDSVLSHTVPLLQRCSASLRSLFIAGASARELHLPYLRQQGQLTGNDSLLGRMELETEESKHKFAKDLSMPWGVCATV